MPLTLPSKRDQEIVERAVENPEGTEGEVVLFVEGKDHTERLGDVEWGQADVSISMDGELAGLLPRRLENGKVELFVEVEGVLAPQMVGAKTRIEVGEDNASTDLLSASAGALLMSTPLREIVPFPGSTPEDVVRRTLRRLEAYGSIRVESLGAPIFDLVGDRAMQPEDMLLDILEVVNDKAELYAFRDTPTGGHVAEVYRGFGRAEDATRTYDARDIADWRRPPLRAEQYHSVEVFRLFPDGTDDYRERAKVPYGARTVEPPIDNVLLVPSTDGSPEAEGRAARFARDEARKLALGLYGGEATLPSFDPLVQKGDFLRVEAAEYDDDGLWDRVYLLLVDGYTHTRGDFLDTSVSFSATILEEEMVKVPDFVGPGLTGGVVLELFSARRDGPKAGLLAKTGVGGAVRTNASGRWFDPEESEGQIRVDGSGLWIEVA